MGMLDGLKRMVGGKPDPKAAEAESLKAEQDEAARAADDLARAAESQRMADTLPLMGSHGQELFQGIFREEYHEDLSDPLARVERLNELRVGDSVVSSQLRRIEIPIRQAEWSIEPDTEQAEAEQDEAAAAEVESESQAEGDEPKAMAEAGPDVDPEAQEDEPAAAPGPSSTERDFASALKANILGKGPRVYRMATTWGQWVHEACTSLAFGYSLWERELQHVDGPLGSWVLLKRLQWMHPRSLRRWLPGEDGTLLGVEQWARKSYYTLPGSDAPLSAQDAADALAAGKRLECKTGFQLVTIPATRLVLISHDREGVNFEGIAATRRVYMDAKHAAFLRKAQRIDAQKRAIGVPYAKADKEASPETTANVVTQLKRMRGGAAEMSYVFAPPGVEIGFMDMDAHIMDVSPSMRAAEERIAFGFGTEFTRRGAEGSGGSYSAAEIQADYFNLNLTSMAEWLRQEFQSQVIEPLAEVNGFSERPPVLRVTDVTPTDATGIVDAKQKGALTWTDEDEQELRRRLKWRPLSAVELAQRAAKKAKMEALAEAAVGLEPGESGAPKPDGKDGKPAPPAAPMVQPPKELAAASVPGPYRRQPTAHEQAHGRLAEVRAAYDAFLVDFTQAMRPLREAAVRDAIKRLRIEGHRGTVVGRLKDKTLKATAKALAERMRELGRDTARTEIQGQLAKEFAAPPPFDPFKPLAKPGRLLRGLKAVSADLEDAIDVSIELNVRRIIDQVVGSIESEVLTAIAGDMTEEQAVAAAQRAVLGMSDRSLEDAARDIASNAYNGGRSEVVEQALEQGVPLTMARRTEVLDDRTCDTCEGLDGLTVEIESDEYWANMPPAKCEGGAWCRGYYEFEVDK